MVHISFSRPVWKGRVEILKYLELIAFSYRLLNIFLLMHWHSFVSVYLCREIK
jgi:hypothetical protein